MNNIKAYPQPMHIAGEPWWEGFAQGMTLEKWLEDNLPGYERGEDPPICIALNGHRLDPVHWPHHRITAADRLAIHPRPEYGGGVIAAAIVGLVVAAAALAFRPSLPTQTNRTTQEGAKLLEASASANQVKLNDVIPEIAGRVKRYPDYLNAPRRHFVNRDEQTMHMLVAITKGEIDYDPEEIFIGNTPLPQLGSGLNFEIFPPGADLSGIENHQNWYNAPEVGPAVGASGIRLTGVRDVDQSWDGNLTFNGDQVTGSDGAPSGWAIGTNVDIRIPQTMTVIDGGGTSADIIRGELGWLALSPGVHVTVPEIAVRPTRVLSYTPDPNDPSSGDLTLEWQSSVSGAWIPINDLNPGSVFVTFAQEGMWWTVSGVVTDGLTFAPRINGDPVASWPGFPTGTWTNADITLRGDPSQGLWTLPFAACPAGEVTNRIEVDVFFPQGLVERGETSGNLYDLSVRLQVQYRPVGTTAWTTILDRTVTDNNPDQIGLTFGLGLPSAMRPEFRMRRVQAESDSPFKSDKAEWYGMRARLDAPTSYPGITVMSVTLTGSDLIAAQTDNQINLFCTRKLPVMQGPRVWTTEPQPTRDLSAWIRHIAISAGYSDADIDQEELWRLHQIWTARGDTFDYIEGDDSTVKEVLARVMRVGFAELTITEGKIKPIRDEPRTAIQNVYSAQNMTDPLKYTVTMPRHDDPDGVDVEYTDETTWASATVPCRLPGDAGIHPEQIKAEGIVSRAKAYQLGMRHRSILQYRRKAYAFSTELDALNSEYLSYDALITDVPGQGQSMLCENVEGTTLYVTEPLDWSQGGDYLAAWRRLDGSLSGPYPALRGPDDFSLVLGGDDPELPTIEQDMEPPHVFFGPMATWRHPVLMTNLTPEGFQRVSVEAVGYDDRVYEYDDALPPNLQETGD